jgi:hypothetical protein
MKKLLVLFALIISISTIAQDMQKYLTETEEMVIHKKYQEANERYAWFQNHSLEHDPAMTGVRLSYALSYWKSLADIYSPAMATMKEMRYYKTKQLVYNNASVNLFADVAALNRELNEKQKTIELFEKINNQDHEKAKKCWYYAKEDLFAAKRYDILRKFIGNPMNEFESIKDERNKLLNSFKESEHRLKRYIDNSFVEKCLSLIQFSLASDDIASAKQIRAAAILIVKDNRLKDI